MKKLLFVLALGAFAACGSGENANNAADSAAKVDSTPVVAPDTTAVVAPVDTTAKADTAAAVKP